MLLGVVSANALRKMRASDAPEGLRAPRNDELIPCHVVCVERRNGATRCFLEATHVTPAMARRCLLQCAKDAVERCAIERAELPPSPITAMVLGDLRLGVPGRHNVLNALAAVTVSLELDLPFSQVQEALHDFGGVDRRFSVRAEIGDVLVVDDYGHHPVEIQATLAAAAEGYEGRRIVAVFQPHRYSRVQDLWEQFCGSFHAAAHVVVCPVYAAGEKPIEGVDAARIVKGLSDRGHRSVVGVDTLDAATEHLAGYVRPGDIVITLGAGDVNRVCGALADRMRAAEGGQPGR